MGWLNNTGKNCVCAILPKCWKNGNGNASYGVEIEDVHSTDAVAFPIYIGPIGNSSMYCNLIQNIIYDSSTGIIEPVKLINDRIGILKFYNINFDGMNDATNTTFSYWGDINAFANISSLLSIAWANYPEGVATQRLNLLLRNVASAFSLRMATGTGTYQTVRSADFNPDGLRHFVWVKNGVDMKLYVDGVEVLYHTKNDWTGTYNPSPNYETLDLWCYYNNANSAGEKANNTHGAIIYNKALTADEVLYDYTLGPDLGGLLGYANTSLNTLTLIEPSSEEIIPEGDIRITYNSQQGYGDIAEDQRDLERDSGLETAILISLLTDRRADDEDILPDSDGGKRGWWGDEFTDDSPTIANIGSKLWLVGRSKLIQNTAAQVQEFVEQALEYLVSDGVASGINVEVLVFNNETYEIRIKVIQPETTNFLFFTYFFNWKNQVIRSA